MSSREIYYGLRYLQNYSTLIGCSGMKTTYEGKALIRLISETVLKLRFPHGLKIITNINKLFTVQSVCLLWEPINMTLG
jgi:hypothetical protein